MKKILVVAAVAALALSGRHAQAQVIDSTQMRLQMQQQRAAEAKSALDARKQETAATRSNVDQTKAQLKDQENAIRDEKRKAREAKKAAKM
jgi:ABC-type phosphate transport system auxiliary subunit